MGGGACSSVTVDRIYLNAEGNHLIGTSGDESKLNCTAAGGLLTLDSNRSNKRDMLALLMLSQVTKQSLSIRLIDNSSNCEITYISSPY